MSSITIDEVTVTYDTKCAVDAFTLSVAGGEWVALLGPNGAGKTSVLRAIAGLTAFDGVISIDSASVRNIARRRLAQLVAYVPQRPILPTGATVTDYVLMGRNPYIRYFATESKSDVDTTTRVLHRLDLAAFADRDVASLSGGEAQRVVMARALAQEAPILLLDEPTSELDVGRQQHVLELVDELRIEVGLTVLSTMHDLTLAGQYAQQFVLLSGGRAVARGSAEEVLSTDLIEQHYGASVEVLPCSSGVVVVPRRRPSRRYCHERG